MVKFEDFNDELGEKFKNLGYGNRKDRRKHRKVSNE